MCFFCSWGTFWGSFVPGVAIFLGWGTFWPDFVPGVAIFLGWGTFRGRFVPGGSIPTEGSIPAEGVFPAGGLSFVCRYKSVAGNLFFIPAVFFPHRGDELALVVDPESHVCDRQSFLYVVGLVEGAD